MRRCLMVLFLFVLCASSYAQRARYNFNRGWLLNVGDAAEASSPSFDDSKWQRVTTPHAWNEDSAYRVSIHEHPTGIAWYRKHFKLPAIANGSRVYVEFESVRQGADVYLNGQLLGSSDNGVMAFGFDLTPYLKSGDNVIAVRTDNRWDYREKATNSTVQWNNNNFFANFGGINRNVWLHITPAVHQTLPLYSKLGTTGQYIWADRFNIAAHSATIHIETQTRNDSAAATTVRLHAEIIDQAGKTVASVTSDPTHIDPQATQTLSTQVPARGLEFWSWGYGYLYKVVTTLIIDNKTTDAVTTTTGFRETAFRNGMIYLNGRVIQIHGYAARTTAEWPALGTNVPPWVSDFSNNLLVESNGNLVRWMHVTPSKQDVESCDRAGLLQAMPAGDAEGDPSGRRFDARVELMRDAIIYNRNNPSILFYESGNKGISDEHMQMMLAVRNQYDPHGGRLIGSREMLASKTAEYGGEMLYINKSASRPLWAHEYNRDEGARKFWDDQTTPFHKDSPLYNRNQDSYTIGDVLTWDDYFRARPGTGRRVSSGGVNISWTDENSHFRGDNNYRRSGEVDAMRIPKDSFYAHQVMWDGWVDPEHARVHINGHWNYPAGTKRTVYVEANTASVELKLNGKSLGKQTPKNDFLFTFADVTYATGTLEAIAYDRLGNVAAKTTLASTGAPASIRLTPHTSADGLHADGSDLALVDVELLDTDGRRVPTAMNMVHFSVDGPAEWRGGIAQGSAKPVPVNTEETHTEGMAKTAVAPFLHDDNYILSKDIPVECGINRVSIRSREAAGSINITAKVDGLPDAHLTLVSKAVAEHDGLSEFDPAATQPVSLVRGPTPSTPSFNVSRVTIPVVAVTAGANGAEAAKTMDDNETTSWSNGPSGARLDNAWIEYTFAQPSTPTSVDLKLDHFRLKRYPLRILLDGKTIYEGTTINNLGYVTLPLKTTKPGKVLRIELTDNPYTIDEKNALVEVNGKIDQSDAKSRGKSPVLSIIEAEIYSAPLAK